MRSEMKHHLISEGRLAAASGEYRYHYRVVDSGGPDDGDVVVWECVPKAEGKEELKVERRRVAVDNVLRYVNFRKVGK